MTKNPFRSVLALGLSCLVLVLLPSAAFADREVDRLARVWPVEEPPLGEWSLIDFGQDAKEITLGVRHRVTGEILDLILRRRDESEPAFARTHLYNLFYRSKREERHTSPEADRLLGAFAAWLRAREGPATALLPYREAVELERRKKAAEAAESRAREEERRRLRERLDRYGPKRLIGERAKLALDGQRLRLWLGLLLLCGVFFLFPRINKLNWAFNTPDVDWAIPRFSLLLPAAAAAFALRAGAALDPADWLRGIMHGAKLQMGADTTALIPDMLTAGWAGLGGWGHFAMTAFCGLMLIAAALLLFMLSYTFFWDRRAAAFALLLYLLARLTAVPDASLLSALLFDIVLCGTFLALVHQAYDTKNSRRLVFAAVWVTLAIWLEPAAIILVPFILIYLLLESQDRERTFSYPLTWIVPLFAALFAVPVFVAAGEARPPAIMPELLFSGWADAPAYFAALPAAIVYNKFVLVVLVILGLVLHGAGQRRMAWFAAALLLTLFLAAMGMKGFGPSLVLGGQLLSWPCLLAGLGLSSLVDRLDADRRFWRALAITAAVVAAGLLTK